MAQSDKDDFNLDDLQFSEPGLTPLAGFADGTPAADSSAVKQEKAASVSEEASPLEPEDKKARKKAKKVKEKKSTPSADAAEGQREKFDLRKQLSQASPYTVLLGMTLVALLLAVVFLLIELNRYDFHIKAPKEIQGLATIESVASPRAGLSATETA